MQIQKLTMLLKYQEKKKNMYLAGYDEEKILKEAIKEGIEQSRLENIKNVMEGLNYTAQQAMDLLDIPVDHNKIVRFALPPVSLFHLIGILSS